MSEEAQLMILLSRTYRWRKRRARVVMALPLHYESLEGLGFIKYSPEVVASLRLRGYEVTYSQLVDEALLSEGDK